MHSRNAKKWTPLDCAASVGAVRCGLLLLEEDAPTGWWIILSLAYPFDYIIYLNHMRGYKKFWHLIIGKLFKGEKRIERGEFLRRVFDLGNSGKENFRKYFKVGLSISTYNIYIKKFRVFLLQIWWWLILIFQKHQLLK